LRPRLPFSPVCFILFFPPRHTAPSKNFPFCCHTSELSGCFLVGRQAPLVGRVSVFFPFLFLSPPRSLPIVGPRKSSRLFSWPPDPGWGACFFLRSSFPSNDSSTGHSFFPGVFIHLGVFFFGFSTNELFLFSLPGID